MSCHTCCSSSPHSFPLLQLAPSGNWAVRGQWKRKLRAHKWPSSIPGWWVVPGSPRRASQRNAERIILEDSKPLWFFYGTVCKLHLQARVNNNGKQEPSWLTTQTTLRLTSSHPSQTPTSTTSGRGWSVRGRCQGSEWNGHLRVDGRRLLPHPARGPRAVWAGGRRISPARRGPGYPAAARRTPRRRRARQRRRTGSAGGTGPQTVCASFLYALAKSKVSSR